MQSRSYLFLLLVLGLTVGSAILFQTQDYKFGLDVRGGVRFTFRMSNVSSSKMGELALIQERTQKILGNRIAGLGLVEANVLPKGRDQLIVEIPDFTDENQARKLLLSTASIKFYEAKTVPRPDRNDSETRRPYAAQDDPKADPSSPRILFENLKTGDIIEPAKDGKPNPEYLKVIESWGPPILEGEDLASASHDLYGNNYVPKMNFSAEGAKKMRAWSGPKRNSRENIAAVLDDVVLSVAALQANTVLSDHAIITGTFSDAYVKNLVDLLNAGALPVELVEESFQKVHPTIGQQALDLMVNAGLVAFGITALYLVVYYAFPGFVALVALVLYVLFTLSVLKVLGATFSLAAIAGFILSVGMAVDANILVFERFKEEMKAGRTLQTAIELGFRRALPAILDSNACTIITSIVLANLGTGPVKGFAVTLIIGLAVSLFTAVTVTRSLLVFLVGSGLGSNPKWYALDRNWFGGRLEGSADSEPLQIVNKPKKWFIISIISIVVCLPFVFIGGLKPNVEFRGGYEVSLSLKGKDLTVAQITETLEKNGISGANVKLAGQGDTLVAVVTAPLEVAKEGDKTEEVVARIAQAGGFNPAFAGAASGDIVESAKVADGYEVSLSLKGKDLTTAQITETLEKNGVSGANVKFEGEGDTLVAVVKAPLGVASEGEKTEDVVARIAQAAGFSTTVGGAEGGDIVESGKVGESVRFETIRNAILGVLLSIGLIVIYLAFRFGLALGNFVAGLRFGFSAIGALFHDVLFVLGVTALVGYLFHWEISALFITSMLTVIGFSVHDTIVIFDRIRENLRKPQRGEDFANLANRSITQSYARSINTSLTVIATLIVLLVMGTSTPDLKLFTVTMLAGILSGTYSSIYNASPILYLWDKAIRRKRGDDASFMGMAAAEAVRARAAQLTVTAEERTVKDAQGRSYGQVKRRSGSQQQRKGDVEMDDEDK